MNYFRTILLRTSSGSRKKRNNNNNSSNSNNNNNENNNKNKSKNNKSSKTSFGRLIYESLIVHSHGQIRKEDILAEKIKLCGPGYNLKKGVGQLI